MALFLTSKDALRRWYSGFRGSAARDLLRFSVSGRGFMFFVCTNARPAASFSAGRNPTPSRSIFVDTECAVRKSFFLSGPVSLP